MLDKKTIEEQNVDNTVIKYPDIKDIFDKQIKHQFKVFGIEKGKENYDMEYFYSEIESSIDKTILQILDDVAGEEETFEDFENDKLHPVAVFKKGREEKRQEILDYKDKFK